MSSVAPPFKEEEQATLKKILSLKDSIGRAVIGQKGLIEELLIALLCRGHLLIEGLPGLAKTLTAKTVAQSIQAEFKRIQFTPDLLPADLLGTPVYRPQEGTFYIKKGPIFTEILLADEINRAPPKVQSALLEAMGENQVTIGDERFPLGELFMVLATQNPIEQEGTYPLPEAQTDRFFMKAIVTYPSKKEEREVLDIYGGAKELPKISPILTVADLEAARKVVKNIYVDEKVKNYILDLVGATRDPATYKAPLVGLLEYGASPRASLALLAGSQAKAFLEARSFVVPQDVKDCAPSILRHRLHPSYEAEAEGLSSDAIIATLLKTLPVP